MFIATFCSNNCIDPIRSERMEIYRISNLPDIRPISHEGLRVATRTRFPFRTASTKLNGHNTISRVGPNMRFAGNPDMRFLANFSSRGLEFITPTDFKAFYPMFDAIFSFFSFPYSIFFTNISTSSFSFYPFCERSPLKFIT